MQATITVNDETEREAQAVILDIIRAAQNGVTLFSARGALMNILLSLKVEFHSED